MKNTKEEFLINSTMIEITKISFFTKKFKFHTLFEEWELFYQYRFFKEIHSMFVEKRLNTLLLENLINPNFFELTQEFFDLENSDSDFEEIFACARLSCKQGDWEMCFLSDHNFAILGYNKVKKEMIEKRFLKFKTDSIADRMKAIEFTFDKKSNFKLFKNRLANEFPDLQENYL